MKLNRFVQRGKPTPIHSSGFVQSVGRIGASSVNPFSQRQEVERSRRLVGGYREAKVLREPKHDSRYDLTTSRINRPTTSDDANTLGVDSKRLRASRTDTMRPASSPTPPSSSSSSSRHTYREPPSRHRS